MTDLRLFHNHMTIEPVLEIFGHFHSKAIARMRRSSLKNLPPDNLDGYSPTCDLSVRLDCVEHVADMFESRVQKSTMWSLWHPRRYGYRGIVQKIASSIKRQNEILKHRTKD